MSGPSLAADLGSLPAEAHQPRKRSFGKKWSLIEVFSLRGLRNGPGYTINNYVKFNHMNCTV